MIPLKQLRTLQPELDWDGPGLVFTSRKACQATDTFVADQDASVEHGAQAKRIPWDLEFQELPLDTRHGFVFVEPIASTLNLRALRSVLHRCVRLLRVGGHGHLVLADPDDLRQRQPEAWPGDAIPFERETHHYRPWRQWWELLRLFPLVPMTPRLIPEVSDAPKFLLLSFEKTAEVSSLSRESESSDKYGAQSSYRRFDRLEEPEILDDWCYAASKLRPQPGETVLSLGCNDGRELEMFSPKQQADVRFVGVDASASAIASARQTYRHEFHCHDVMEFPELKIGPVHVVLMLNLLQCTDVNREQLLPLLVEALAPSARLLLSIPNCHFGANDILRRPLDRDSERHDRSLIHKDLRYLTRFFYRHGFGRIESFGTYDAFLLIRR